MDHKKIQENISSQYETVVKTFQRLTEFHNQLLDQVHALHEHSKDPNLESTTYYRIFLYFSKCLSQLLDSSDEHRNLLDESPLKFVIANKLQNAAARFSSGDHKEPSTSSDIPIENTETDEITETEGQITETEDHITEAEYYITETENFTLPQEPFLRSTESDKMLKIIQNFFDKYDTSGSPTDSQLSNENIPFDFMQVPALHLNSDDTDTDTVSSVETVILSSKCDVLKTEDIENDGSLVRDVEHQENVEIVQLNCNDSIVGDLEDTKCNGLKTEEHSQDESPEEPQQCDEFALPHQNNIDYMNNVRDLASNTTSVPEIKTDIPKPEQGAISKNLIPLKSRLDKAKALILREDTLPIVGDTVMITHIDSPSDFYVQVCDDKTAVLNQLHKYIRSMYEKTTNTNNSKLEAERNMGTYCVGYSPRYEIWFRAKVVDWLQEVVSDYVHVLNVDCGQRHFLSYKTLRPLRPDIAELPVMAIRCCLPYLYPPASTLERRLTEWPSKSLTAVCNMTGIDTKKEISYSDQLMVTFVQKSEDGEKVLLDIRNPNFNSHSTIAQTLLESELAVQIYDSNDSVSAC